MKRLKKELSKIIKNKYLTYDDLEILSLLLNVNINLKDSLLIIKNNKNQLIINNLIYELDLGKNYNQLFRKYLKNDIKEYLTSFLSYLSFKDALKLSLSIANKERYLKNEIIKHLTYPISLMIFSLLGIYLFNSYCFEPLINSFKSFNSDLSHLVDFKNILNIFITIIFIIILIILCLVLIFTKKKRIVFAYSLLQKYLSSSKISEYLSSRFVIYFSECHKVGLKTKDSINILKSLKSEPLISFIAFHIDEALLSGKDMVEAISNPYLDTRLKSFIEIAINTTELNKMLEGYLSQFEMRFKKYTTKMSKMIQIFSYVLIGIVIIFIYQLLFIPMGLLGEL